MEPEKIPPLWWWQEPERSRKVLENILIEQKATKAKLEELLGEQKKTSLYTLTLERDRLLAVIYNAGLGTVVVGNNEFVLAPGATATVIQVVPAGQVYIIAGDSDWGSSLPWWVSYSLWVDSTPPAPPIATGIRMPEYVKMQYAGIVPIYSFIVHQCTNLHAVQTAYCAVKNMNVSVSLDTWKMVKAIYLDSLLKDLRDRALEISGLPR